MTKQFEALPVYFVRKGSPAWDAFKRLCGNYKPGAVIPVDDEQFDALKDDVLILRIADD